MLERRIREVIAMVLSKSAKVLERTAGELAHAASELRSDEDRDDAEQAWADEPKADAQPMIRSAPLRAVPDTPTDEPEDEVGAVITPPGAPWTPPEDPPEVPRADRPGKIDVVETSSAPGTFQQAPTAGDRILALSSGTVSEIRAQLDDLSPNELRRLKEAELADRRRTTLIAAIDRALAGSD